jgi:hypothetical protein
MMVVFTDFAVEVDTIRQHSNMNTNFLTEQERQNQLDDLMRWKRGWRDYGSAQDIKERLAYLYEPDDCDDDLQERKLCKERYDELVKELATKLILRC